MIGGLIGVHVSSNIRWGCQDNFKLVYFFFDEKISRARKAQKRKTNDFYPLKILCVLEKLLPLLFSVNLFLFCQLIFTCVVFFCFLCAWTLFVKKIKNKKINRLKIVLTASFNITTRIYLTICNKGFTSSRSGKVAYFSLSAQGLW